MIIYNSSRAAFNRYYFEQYDTVNKLLKLRNTSIARWNMITLFALAYLIDEENNHLIITGPGKCCCFIAVIFIPGDWWRSNFKLSI